MSTPEVEPYVHRLMDISRLACLVLAASCSSPAAPGTPNEPVAVAAVVVTPVASDLVLTGTTTAQLVATTRDAAGAELTGRSIAWASSNTGAATVSAGGLVTAVAAGTASISATSEGVSGAATVTVTAGGGGGGGGGATVLIQEGFEDDAYASRGWYDGGTFTTTTAEHASGARALVGTFAVGAQNPSWFGGRWSFAPTTSVYLRFRVKYSTNWVGSGGTSHPHEFFFMTTENGLYGGPARTRLTTYVEHNYTASGGVPIISWQDGENIDESRVNQNLVGVTEARSVSGCNGVADGLPATCYTVGTQYWNGKGLRATTPRFLPSPGPGYKNDWHTVEAYFQLNTIVNGIGQTDGIARYWFDGQLVLEATNAQFRTGRHPNMRFNQMLLSPYIGNGSPVQQTMWVDDILVATARP